MTPSDCDHTLFELKGGGQHLSLLVQFGCFFAYTQKGQLMKKETDIKLKEKERIKSITSGTGQTVTLKELFMLRAQRLSFIAQ